MFFGTLVKADLTPVVMKPEMRVQNQQVPRGHSAQRRTKMEKPAIKNDGLSYGEFGDAGSILPVPPSPIQSTTIRVICPRCKGEKVNGVCACAGYAGH